MSDMELSPRLKTAILLISLPADAASAIMRSFSPEEMKAISAEMAKARTIPPEIRAKVVQEFLEKTGKAKRQPAQKPSAPATPQKKEEKEAPVPIAQNLQSLLGARATPSSPSTSATRAKVRHPFAFLLEVDPKKIAYVLKDEDPQMVAAILGNLPAPVATKILAFLPSSIQGEVPKRIQSLSKLSEEVMRALVDILKEELENVLPVGPSTAKDHMQDFISHMDKVTERRIIDRLSLQHPSLASHFKGKTLEFEDIMVLEPNAIRELIRITDTRDLLIALKGAPMELVNKVLSVLPPQKAKALMEDLKMLQDVSEEEIRRAQQQIRNNLRGLITIGKIKFPGT